MDGGDGEGGCLVGEPALGVGDGGVGGEDEGGEGGVWVVGVRMGYGVRGFGKGEVPSVQFPYATAVLLGLTVAFNVHTLMSLAPSRT